MHSCNPLLYILCWKARSTSVCGWPVTIYGVPGLFTAQRRDVIQPEESCQPVLTHSIKTCQLEICKQIQKLVEIHNLSSILHSIVWVLLILFFFFFNFSEVLVLPPDKQMVESLSPFLWREPLSAPSLGGTRSPISSPQTCCLYPLLHHPLPFHPHSIFIY